MSTFNVPEQALEPKESPNMELITNINHECEKATYNIKKMEEEYEQAEEFLNLCEYLSFDLKENVRDHYITEIVRRQQDLNDMKAHLEELGAF